MTKEEIELIFKLYEEKMELRKIARVLGRSLSRHSKNIVSKEL